MSTPAEEQLVLVEKANGYAVLTLNRPKAMNALSRALRAAISDAVDALEADPDVRVLIITGAGRAFCAGLDLKELGSDTSGLGANAAITDKDPVSSLGRFSGPIIGAINGVAITGGFELALAADVLLASSEARFADTHARVGILPGWGLSQKLSRAIGISRAKELSLTGNFLSAQQASDWGLVNRVVAPEELLPQARKLAEDMLSVDPASLVAYKRMIDEGFALAFGEAMKHELKVSKEANAKVSASAVESRREGIRQRGQSQTGAA
jgi:enoyl-CoA hydratase